MTQEEREWSSVQAKTFTKWVNEKLVKRGHAEIGSILEDLGDGVGLAHLLMALQSDVVEYNPHPYTRIQKMENMECVLRFIKEKRVKLINIGPADIVDGNHKLILGLVWSLIARLGIKDMAELGELSIKKELLKWCKDVTRGYGVDVTDFSRSWQDGIAFNAIIHRFRPDLVPNISELRCSDSAQNLEQAFEIAEQNLGIRRLLDVEDISDTSVPDERSIMTYVSSYYERFKEFEKEKSAFNRIRDVLEAVDWSIQSRNLYEIKARGLLSMVKELAGKRGDVLQALDSLDTTLSSLWELNSRAVSECAEIHGLLGSINAVHGIHSMKKYTPPEDVHISKLDFASVIPQDLNDSRELRRLFDKDFQLDMNVVSGAFEHLKQIFSQERSMQEQRRDAEDIHNSLCGVNLSDPTAEALHKEFRNTAKRKVDLLEKTEERESDDRMLENATELFHSVCGERRTGISSADLYSCLNQLGFAVDEDMVSFASAETQISLEDYLLIVRETHRVSLDSGELRKAFKMLSMDNNILDLRSLNMSDKDLKNIYYYNRNASDLKIDEFFESFIED